MPGNSGSKPSAWKKLTRSFRPKSQPSSSSSPLPATPSTASATVSTSLVPSNVTTGTQLTTCTPSQTAAVQAPGATTSPQNAADKKVNDGLKVAMNAFRQFLVVTNAATPVFTPLQSVAGGLLAVIDTLQECADNREELERIRQRFHDFNDSTMCYDEPRVPDKALQELRSCFDRQLKIVEERLNDGNLRGIFTAHSVAGDIVKMLHIVDEALRKFQVQISLDVKNMLLHQERRGMAEWITSATFKGDYEIAINVLTPGTGQWLLEHENFIDWYLGRHPVLWCHGNPGVGKTILSAHIIKHLTEGIKDKKKPNDVVLFIYCNYERRYDLSTLLKGLLRQLVIRSVRSSTIRDFWKNDKSLDIESLNLALKSEMDTYDTVFLIVDALDELDSEVQSKLIQTLRHLPLRLLITSRPTIADSALFPDGRAEIDISTNVDDLRCYVDRRLQEPNDAMHEAIRQRSLKCICDQVIAKADRMFLLARLHLDSLKECVTHGEVFDSLATLPTTLNEKYDSILERIKDHGLHALLWIAFSSTTLTTDDLCYVLAVPRSEGRIDDRQLLVPSDGILRLCGGLVRTQEVWDSARGFIQTCAFVHYTVEGYLRDMRNSLLSSEGLTALVKQRMSDSRNHQPSQDDIRKRFERIRGRLLTPEQMLQYCVKYLSFFGSIRSINSLQYPRYQLPILTYAAARSLPSLLRDVGDLSASKLDYSFMSASDTKLLYLLWDVTSERKWWNVTSEWSLRSGISFLTIAARHNLRDVFQYVLHTFPQLIRFTLDKHDNGYHAMASGIVEGGSVWALEELQRCGVDLLRSALLSAARAGSAKTLETVLKFDGIDINWRDDKGRTALALAAIRYDCSTDIIECLLSVKGVDVDAEDWYGRTPLSYAAGHNDTTAIIVALLSRGANASSTDRDGRRPLSYAVRTWKGSGLANTKALLAIPDVNVNSSDKWGRTPLWYATDHGSNSQVVEELLKIEGIIVDTKDLQYGQTPLFRAASNGDAASVEALLATGAVDVNFTDNEGQTLLHAACRHDVMHVLLNAGALPVDINMKDKHGQTALSHAARDDDDGEKVEALLAIDGLDLDTRDADGRTPLSYAAQAFGQQGFDLLISTGLVDVHSRDNVGRSILSYAVSGYTGANKVRALLALPGGVEVDSKDHSGRTPLSYAAERNRETVEALLATGNVDVESRDKNGRTPLSYAAERNGEIVEVLLATGNVDIESRDKDGRTPLSHAANAQHWLHRSDTMEVLLQVEGIKVNTQDMNGWTPLHHACSHSEYWTQEKMEILMAFDGIDINLTDKDGRSPFARAAEISDADAVDVLLSDSRLVVDLRSRSGRTPLSYAAGRHAGPGPLEFYWLHGRLRLVRTISESLARQRRKQKQISSIVQAILSASTEGNNLDPRDIHGLGPLHYSVCNAYVDEAVANTLLDHKGIGIKVRRRRLSASYPTKTRNELMEALVEVNGINSDRDLLSDARVFSVTPARCAVFEVAECLF